MNHAKNSYLSDLELESVHGGGVSSHSPNTTHAPTGGSGPAGTQNPTLGTMGTGVTVLTAVMKFI